MKKYSAFYIPYLLFVLTLIVLIGSNEKANLHLWMISFNSPAADVFFRYYTFVGDWIPYAVVGGFTDIEWHFSSLFHNLPQG